MNFIEAMIAAAGQAPHAPLTIASDVRPAASTLGEVVRAGRQMGTGMTAAGIAPGDIVACMLPNWREWLVVAVAAAQAGAVMLPIVTIYGAKELGFILRQSDARWLFTPDHFRNVDFAGVVAGCGDLPGLRRHVMTGADFDALASPCPIGEPADVAADAMSLLVYTSGTTADPKGVMHSARTFLAELASMREMRREAGDDAVISPWPPGHVAGALSMYRFLCQATPLVLMDQWDAALAAELIDRHKVTSSSGTPFHLSGMIAAADAHGHDLTSLRQYLVGAAPVPPSLIARCRQLGLAVYHCYGSSEHPTVTSGVVDDPLDKQLHTEGRAIPGSELRFVDDDGNDVPSGSDGEICTRGPELFLGYLDPALNVGAFFPGGWYRTGDIGRVDTEGYLLITDRKKDIIIRGGENISSKEVETLLLSHPAIVDAAAVAAPDERMGEVVRACVVLAPGTALTLDELREHFFAAGIAKQKTPERLSILPELPRNASGKVLKHELRRSA
ncbi:acyl-CoA synthetase (AMP-forming)/AMP-acid ligase II [Sphingopyxis panaciterrae]|uniref:AMP-binding protein n=1 Tax=Sphingopyxis panaciterrae TaxID=363841 RepID=UPI00141EB6A3|nr:AMP-binding protein [Sphingopyxis panaciterrae]NIJ36753.1 acyl-CoA synthetase (AMP-forming)/AMP-acid ligase II [Sphingopyxis panaciterrae]